MKLYDASIQKMQDFFKQERPTVYPYQASKSWPLDNYNELILKRDAAFELGNSPHASVNCTYVTQDESLVSQDEIWVYGAELNQIHQDSPFVRFSLLLVDDLGESDEQVYTTIKQLDYIRYNVHPLGYMNRVSSESHREEIRISHDAIQQGITFEQVGNAYINKYKENPHVKKVKMIFATGFHQIDDLIENTKEVKAITKTLTVILDSLIADCSKCHMKAVCDTVDGLREMHMKKIQQKGDPQ